jgi:hypothetical protein
MQYMAPCLPCCLLYRARCHTPAHAPLPSILPCCAVFDTVDLFLPDVQFATEASYVRLPPLARQRVREAGLPFREGLHAASHALLNVLPLHLMSNPNDVGTGESACLSAGSLRVCCVLGTSPGLLAKGSQQQWH